MSKTWDMETPLRVYGITLAANERRPVHHGRAASIFIPIQGAGRDVPADALRIGFGTDSDLIPVTEGIFISAPGVEGWNVTVFLNTTASPISFEYVLGFDPSVLIIRGV